MLQKQLKNKLEIVRIESERRTVNWEYCDKIPQKKCTKEYVL